jgi:hypothetical protein
MAIVLRFLLDELNQHVDVISSQEKMKMYTKTPKEEG